MDVNRLLEQRKQLLSTLADMTQLAFDATQYHTPKDAEGKTLQQLDRARINKALALIETLSKEVP